MASHDLLVAGGRTFRSVITGLELSCGLATDGETYCWGNDVYGQIGDGTTVAEPDRDAGSTAVINHCAPSHLPNRYSSDS